jgi:hypothetical protein
MKRFFLFLFCFSLLPAGPVSAFDAFGVHNAEFGTELSYITYREPDVDVKEKGLMYGLAGSYTYHKGFMFRLEGKGSIGWVDYSSQSGEISNIRDFMLEGRVLGGYDFSLSKAFLLTPYIGFGYRYLNDDASGKVTTLGLHGYLRESNYYYSPIGLTGWTQLGRGWLLGITAEYDYLWVGMQKSHLGDAVSGAPTVENRQKTGYGLRGSVKFQKKLAGIGLNIEPFIRYWNIDRSEDATGTFPGIRFTAYEPHNDSLEYGLNLSFVF